MAEATAAPAPFTRLKDCRHGRMLYNVNDMYVGRSLDLYGEFSQGEVDLFAQLLRPGDIVLEVGANIGAHTVPIAKLVGPTGMVVALEPQRVPFQMLCANVMLNDLANVWAYQLAAGESAGELKVPDLDPRTTNNFGGLPLGSFTAGNSVRVVRADSFGLPQCRLIKVDVEGMELDVLKGGTGLIARYGPVLYVENDRPERSAALIRYIDGMGYDAYWHKPPLFNPKNSAGNAANAFGAIVSQNMLCVKRAEGQRISGLERVAVPGA